MVFKQINLLCELCRLHVGLDNFQGHNFARWLRVYTQLAAMAYSEAALAQLLARDIL
jgi:hypothetical protein